MKAHYKSKTRLNHKLKTLVDEVTSLRSRVVKQDIYSSAKEEAMREYINKEIAKWNSAIRSTNGIRPGETMESYRRRILEANKNNDT